MIDVLCSIRKSVKIFGSGYVLPFLCRVAELTEPKVSLLESLDPNDTTAIDVDHPSNTLTVENRVRSSNLIDTKKIEYTHTKDVNCYPFFVQG